MKNFFRYFFDAFGIFIVVCFILGMIFLSFTWPVILAQHLGHEAPNFPIWVLIASYMSPIIMISILYALSKKFKVFDNLSK